MKILGRILIVAMALAACSASAMVPTGDGSVTLCKGIAEPNDLKIPVPMTADVTGLTEAQFNQVMDKIQKVYTPIIEKLGGTYQIERLWTNETVNAFATRAGKVWGIHMYGGLARHPLMTPDAMTLVACHETGHIVGSAPHALFMTPMSVEGEADYYGSLKCLRKVFADEDNTPALTDSKLSAFAKGECEKEFSARADQLICMRGAVAGQVLANILSALHKDAKQPDMQTPATNVVWWTSSAHPPAQCRLDTYLNGSRCPVSADVDVSPKDYKIGTCDAQPLNTGSRPRCWFKAWGQAK